LLEFIAPLFVSLYLSKRASELVQAQPSERVINDIATESKTTKAIEPTATITHAVSAVDNIPKP
jgi:hypothetical protein